MRRPGARKVGRPWKAKARSLWEIFGVNSSSNLPSFGSKAEAGVWDPGLAAVLMSRQINMRSLGQEDVTPMEVYGSISLIIK